MAVKLDLFSNETDFIELPAGARVFGEGDRGDVMYVILDGEVDLTIRGRSIETLRNGEIFGEMALVDASPRTASATTKLPCKLVPISQKRFLFMVQQTPHFSLQIMRV